jgi:DNA-binding transcriptional LysR family regulator
MNLNQLAIFHAVAREGNLTRAAAVLCISQPAVSKQLLSLEKSLGTALFHRLSKGVQLTESGELLLEYSTRLFDLEREAERALSELRELQRGRLIIGASTTIGIYLLPEILGEFQKLHPKIELQLEIANTQKIQQELRANKIDLTLTEGILEGNEWQSDAFAHDELIAIAAPGIAARAGSTPSLKDVCALPILLREIGSGTRAVVERALRDKDITLVPAMSLGDTEAIKRAAQSGLGVAFVSRLAVADELENKSLVALEISDWKVERSFYRLRLKGKYETRAAREFMRLLRRKTKNGNEKLKAEKR